MPLVSFTPIQRLRQHFLLRPTVRVRMGWRRLSLSHQFAIAAFFVLTGGMIFLGIWVSSRIERGVVQNTANGAALYINSFIEPHSQSLLRGHSLEPHETFALDLLLKDTPLGRRVHSVKIWRPDGSVAYSNDKSLIDRKFPPTFRLKAALAGKVSAAVETDEDAENRHVRAPGSSLIEIYSPLIGGSPARVYAVAEFYQSAEELMTELQRSRRQSLYAVALTTLAMLSVLFAIVRRGSLTIVQQEARLRAKLMEISETLAENQRLNDRIDEAHKRLVSTNDLNMRRLGAELHDGPAQLISLALLRLDALRPPASADSATKLVDFERVQGALAEALTEIRDMSAGVTLPQLDTMATNAVLQLAARNHERRSGTAVTVDLAQVPNLPIPLKACLYRIAQEGLNNAYRHAGGSGQKLATTFNSNILELQVSDTGGGFSLEPRTGMRLGISGMRDRVTSMGGTFDIQSRPGQGTVLTARFDLSKLKLANWERDVP